MSQAPQRHHRASSLRQTQPSPAFLRAPQSGLVLLLIDGVPAQPPSTPGRLASLLTKRLMDVAVAALAIIALLPFILYIGAVIALNGVAVLKRTPRQGRKGRRFDHFSFSVHRPDGSPILFGSQPLDATGMQHLPALLNVLKGDLAMIGPAALPLVPEMVLPTRYADLGAAMRPGLIGWAQLHGLSGGVSGPARCRARLDHDIAYVQHFSLGLDATILWRTALQR